MFTNNKDASLMVNSQLEPVAGKSKAFLVSGKGNAPKVRKPYTITKQREKWTEDEHQRFLEALKLYGRAWRQIEEHVGTKTAIQIRSHAQKFFTKVTRDSSIDGERHFNPNEIPPPRPKKKPLHPYPRKADSVTAEAMVSPQPEGSPSSDATFANNLSPTSVLSIVYSDPEIHKDCVSPSSNATDVVSAKFLATENDNEYLTSSRPTSKEDDDFHYSVKVSSISAPANNSKMNFELTSQTTFSMDDTSTEESCGSIKLFGKTVLVRDLSKQSLQLIENSESLALDPMEVTPENESEKLFQNLPAHKPEFVSSAVTPFSLPTHLLKSVSSHMENAFGLSWWYWYQTLVCNHLTLCKQKAAENAEDPLCAAAFKEEDDRKKVCLSGSNYGSVSGESKAENQVGVSQQSERASSSGKKECLKGFVPYKRCLAEREDNINLQERESQRARVCS